MIQGTEVDGWLVCRVMLSSRRLLVREASLSGNEVSLPAGKQPNLLFFENRKMIRKEAQLDLDLLPKFCRQNMPLFWLPSCHMPSTHQPALCRSRVKYRVRRISCYFMSRNCIKEFSVQKLPTIIVRKYENWKFPFPHSKRLIALIYRT